MTPSRFTRLRHLMRLHYSPYSSNSLRVLACAAELGVELELHEVDLAAGGQRSPEFLAMNPNGKVPVLEDGDFVLWESTAIINYLAARAEHTTLYPADPTVRAHIHKWQSWTLMHLVRVTDVFLFENVIKGFFGLGERDQDRLARASEDIAPLLTILDQSLSVHGYLIGDAPTLADHHLFAIFFIREQLALPDLQTYSSLSAWIATMSGTRGWSSLNS